jgi:hypothetical protein
LTCGTRVDSEDRHVSCRIDPLGDDLLHGEAIRGKLGVGCDSGGPMTKVVLSKMLRPFGLGLDGFRLPDQHKNETEGLPLTPKSLQRMHYLKLSVPTISSDNSGMRGSLATAKEASLLAGSTDFGSLVKESASLAEQVTATTHAAVRLPRSSAFLPFSCTPKLPTLPQLPAAPLNLRLTRSVWRSARIERPTTP